MHQLKYRSYIIQEETDEYIRELIPMSVNNMQNDLKKQKGVHANIHNHSYTNQNATQNVTNLQLDYKCFLVMLVDIKNKSCQ